VIYLSTPSTPRVREAMAAGLVGCMTTPGQGNHVPAGSWWACDNGAFGDAYVGDDAWLDWLGSRAWDKDRCLFATAPDVVGDALATLERSTPFLPVIRSLGYPAAFVAQDGAEDTGVPWDELDCLFIGGTTEWKLSSAAASLVNQARAHGKWAHMGRVNSWKRWQVADAWGCDSCDGTYIAFAPDRWLPDVLSWAAQTSLFP
jgi:hypothetical protein